MADLTTKGLRFEEGGLLPQAVEDAVRDMNLKFCDVVGFGELDWVELEGASGEPLRFVGPIVLVDFKGRLRTARGLSLRDYVCTLARITDNGVQMLGGKLRRAGIKFIEVSITPLSQQPSEFLDAPRPEPPPRTIEKLISDSSLPEPPAPEVETETAVDLNNRWARAIDESNRVLKRAREAGLDFEGLETKIKRGDLVDHRQFGRCKVIRIGDEHITLRKPDNRNVQLGLSILKFIPKGEEDGRRVFGVEVNTKR